MHSLDIDTDPIAISPSVAKASSAIISDDMLEFA